MANAVPVKQKNISKRATSDRPSWYDMVIEAVSKIDDSKGASVPAIKKYILDVYPTVDAAKMKNFMRKALEKGLDAKILKKPKNWEEKSALSARFKLDKATIAAEAKAKAKKDKMTEQKRATKEKDEKKGKTKGKVEKKTAIKAKSKPGPKSSKTKTVTTPKAKQAKTRITEMKTPKTPKRPKSSAAKSRVATKDKPKVVKQIKATPKKSKTKAKS